MDIGFWQRMFQGSIKWALHTTMTCDLRYSIELAYLQHGKDSNRDNLSQSELKETAVYYFDNHKNRGLTCKASGKQLKIAKYRGLVFPVNDDGKNTKSHSTYHAKISLVAYENGEKTGFRLAVFSKNQEFDNNIAESALLFELKEEKQQTESGKALCAYLNDIKTHSSKAGRIWFDQNIGEQELIQISKTKLMSEFVDNQSNKVAELYFGGVRWACTSKILCSLGSLLRLNCVEEDSVVLTPPEFIRGTEAQHFFEKEKKILYDLKRKNSIERTASHMKLYLLHRKENSTDTYELWTGSANATQRGIGWDFEKKKARDNSSVECLVKFKLNKGEFIELRNSLLVSYEGPFSFKQHGSLDKGVDDVFGVWISNHAKVEGITYLDGEKKQILFSELHSKKSSVKYMQVQLKLDSVLPDEWKGEESVKRGIHMCWRPLEYGKMASLDETLLENVTQITLEYMIDQYIPSQGALCFGTSQAILWMDLDQEQFGNLPQVEERAKWDIRVSDLLLSRTKATQSKQNNDTLVGTGINWFLGLIKECESEFPDDANEYEGAKGNESK